MREKNHMNNVKRLFVDKNIKMPESAKLLFWVWAGFSIGSIVMMKFF